MIHVFLIETCTLYTRQSRNLSLETVWRLISDLLTIANHHIMSHRDTISPCNATYRVI